MAYLATRDAEPRLVRTGYRTRDWQIDTHRMLAKHRWNVLVVHRRAGKTVLCINSIVDAAARFNRFPQGRFGYVAPFLKQAKQVAWEYLKRYTANIPGRKVSEGELWVELPNGNRITIYGADNPDSMLGLYFDGLVIDEYAVMRGTVWEQVLRPTLADRKGWAVFIGTPRGMNKFFELYETAKASPKWGACLLDVYDTKVLDEEELEDAREFMGDQKFRQEFLCDFSASSDDVLITIDMVTDAQRRKVPNVEYLKGLPKVMGVDVARFGDDKTVIQKRWGHFAFKPIPIKGDRSTRSGDNMHVVGRVGQEINNFRPDVVFIDGGRGEGVIDRLIQLGHTNVIEVNFGSSASQPFYANKRTEMWDTAKLWLEAGGVLPDHYELKRDLCTPTYSFTANNRMQLAPKKAKKDVDGGKEVPSTDFGDAFALTFAEPVIPGQFDQTGMATGAGKVISDYDVYAETQEYD